MAELEERWPLKRFPILVDGGRTVVEASIIIEHLQLHHPGPVREGR
jgi:glutathione S-transferase